MKQVIPFIKDISFKTKISEITSIALEHNLSMENNDSIVGDFTVSGKYKINDVSVNEEAFESTIPFDITLDDKYDTSKVKIDIDDFHYEVVNEELLRVHIDVLVSNLVYIKETLKEDDEEKNTLMPEEKEEKIEMIENIVDVKNASLDDDLVREKDTNIDSKEDDHENVIASNFMNEKENYATYKVHIVRENETIDTIKEIYKISKEELEKYNTLDNVLVGTKLIIPIIKDE